MNFELKNVSEYVMRELTNLSINDNILITVNDIRYNKEVSISYSKVYDVSVSSLPPTVYNGRACQVYGKVQILKNGEYSTKRDYTPRNTLSSVLSSDLKTLKKDSEDNSRLFYVCRYLNSECDEDEFILMSQGYVDLFINISCLKTLDSLEKKISELISSRIPYPNRYKITDYIDYLNQEIATCGWVGNDEGSMCTSQKAWESMKNLEPLKREFKGSSLGTLDRLYNSPSSEFIDLLKVLSKKEIISYRDRTLCSFISKIDLEKHQFENSEWVGSLGEKINIKATLLESKEGDGKYGTYYLYRFNSEGNLIFTFSSKLLSLAKNKEYELTVKIKNHECFRNKKTTKVSILSIGENYD